ncbi:MAG: DMT family transporter [Rhodospirillaceae bacterium]|nr:DMT family transporter [Rhodospirillaceae bacterium]MYF87817.1 DMT family transporter [Rhodospirillaceae bacterium]MYH39341.1 DMT family transporter [Rhodospirillaceae bacterium]MYK13947.1 DMT family transporter [Rhodospirillaceae bacterium]
MFVNYLMLLTLGTVWGSSFLFIKLALPGFDPATLALCRTVLGGGFLIGVAWLMGKRPPSERRLWLALLAIALIGNAMPFVMMNTGQQYIDTSLSAILITTVPLFTLGLAHFFSDDKFTWRKLTGVALGFAGVLILLGPAALRGLDSALTGQLLMIGGAACFAVSMIITRRAMGNVDPAISAGWSLGLAAALLLPVSFGIGDPLASKPALVPVLALLALSVLSTVMNILLLFVLIKRTGPNFAAMNNYISPLVGVAWGAIFLAEPVTLTKIAATLTVLAGVAVGTWQTPRAWKRR